MAAYDFTSKRLYVDAPLAAGQAVPLNADQASYLLNVLRLDTGAGLLAFNGRDGEWRTRLERAGKRAASLRVESLSRAQTPASPAQLLFAPLKHARLDYMGQKAVEMGAGRLTPVLTKRTQVHRVNIERMRANAIEAAEQCGVLSVPEVDEPLSFERALMDWPADRPLIFCDEDAAVENPIDALRRIGSPKSFAIIIGPEGGFSPEERAALMAAPGALRISLGPRILRADTAAVAALALVQACLGDWA